MAAPVLRDTQPLGGKPNRFVRVPQLRKVFGEPSRAVSSKTLTHLRPLLESETATIA